MGSPMEMTLSGTRLEIPSGGRMAGSLSDYKRRFTASWAMGPFSDIGSELLAHYVTYLYYLS